jgi:hypothetical protein
MSQDLRIIQWQEGEVDGTREHFELRYGSAEESDWSKWIDIALVAPPESGIVNVHFLVDRRDERNTEAIGYAIKEIKFYLIEKGERDPWLYAQYHCGTGANIYSKVHWIFHQSL